MEDVMRKFYLLTGATGMLGGYLLRDGLLSGDRMAVLARNHRKASAVQRVADLLAPCGLTMAAEGNRHSHSGRPVVLSSDLAQDDLDLDTRSIAWIADNCHSIVHNAASLQFHGPDRRGEPWQTNVEGTRRVLKLCQMTGIHRMHYVSTAYVCGLRSGRILEDELDVGQTLGNDYERSKLESEQMVRDARFLTSLTVYRPAIIVGDSKTFETTGYHGFYAILKLAHTLVSRVQLGATSGGELASILGFTQRESKHFVPVDWVASVMTHIRNNPQFHGRTYHLTARRPTLVSEMASVIQEAVERFSPLASRNDPTRMDGEWIANAFREQMSVYQSYWRDDPQFDQRNTEWAAGHLPCPLVDRQMLMQMARWAIASRFGRAVQSVPQQLVTQRANRIMCAQNVQD
jgi:thioester reductase-like protein